MQTQLSITNNRISLNKRMYYTPLLLVMFLLFLSCSKKDEPSDEAIDEFGYEVECNYCEISYTDQSNSPKIIKNNQGKWKYKINQKITFELKLSVKTTLSTQQNIQAYVLKNDEVVFGNAGYNYATITYNTQKSTGTSSYGAYQNTGSGSGGSNGGSSTPTSSVCGAKNKTGGYCKRVVSGGGRCWQHR